MDRLHLLFCDILWTLNNTNPLLQPNNPGLIYYPGLIKRIPMKGNYSEIVVKPIGCLNSVNRKVLNKALVL